MKIAKHWVEIGERLNRLEKDMARTGKRMAVGGKGVRLRMKVKGLKKK